MMIVAPVEIAMFESNITPSANDSRSLQIVTIYTSEISEIDVGVFIVQIQSNSDIHDPVGLKKKQVISHGVVLCIPF